MKYNEHVFNEICYILHNAYCNYDINLIFNHHRLVEYYVLSMSVCEGEGRDTSRHFKGGFGSMRTMLPM